MQCHTNYTAMRQTLSCAVPGSAIVWPCKWRTHSRFRVRAGGSSRWSTPSLARSACWRVPRCPTATSPCSRPSPAASMVAGVAHAAAVTGFCAAGRDPPGRCVGAQRGAAVVAGVAAARRPRLNAAPQRRNLHVPKKTQPGGWVQASLLSHIKAPAQGRNAENGRTVSCNVAAARRARAKQMATDEAGQDLHLPLRPAPYPAPCPPRVGFG